MAEPRRFRPPWSVVGHTESFVISDADGQDRNGRRAAMKRLTRDEGPAHRTERRLDAQGGALTGVTRALTLWRRSLREPSASRAGRWLRRSVTIRNVGASMDQQSAEAVSTSISSSASGWSSSRAAEGSTGRTEATLYHLCCECLESAADAIEDNNYGDRNSGHDQAVLDRGGGRLIFGE
jgi:hypothetical protein